MKETKMRKQKQELLNEEDNKVEEAQEIITKEEIDTAIQNIKTGKSSGKDKITPEMIKNMGEAGTKLILDIFNKVWQEERIPKDWEVGQIVPIFKKGDKQQCNNYRGITLLSIPLKIYEMVLERKLRNVIEPTLHEAQSGFRKGRSIQDHVFTIKEIINKRLQYNKKTCLAFIDLKKAFDMVSRKRVWKELERRGINTKLITVIRSLYENTRCCVIRNNTTSKEFRTQNGLRQGGTMSPTLFIVFMDMVIRKCHSQSKKLLVGYNRLKPTYISECAYADDIAIIAKNENELELNLNIWNQTLKENGMTINEEKTKIMIICKERQRTNIVLNEKHVEQVQKFKYLGVVFNEDGKQEADINERIEKTNRLYHAMNKSFIGKREISQNTKLNVYNTIFRPTLTYGSETWVIDKRMKRRIEAVEMKYLRRVKGVSMREHRRNIEIRQELGMKPITTFIEQRQLAWWGHLQRMDRNRAVKQIWEAKTIGRRNRGRPQESWNKAVGRVIAAKGKTWGEAQELARDKRLWKKFVYENS